MKILTPLLLILLAASQAYAYAPKGYYPDLEKGKDVRERLHRAIKRGHHSLGYKTARRHLFGEIHLERSKYGYYINDVYCEKDFDERYGVGPMSIPDHTDINCEHTWPQSKFTKRYSRSLQKSDLHHLYPTDNRANSTRGNHPFADVDGRPLPNDCESSRIGSPVNFFKYDSTYFEPPKHHKGNVARAVFYFAVRYEMRINETQEEALRRWHRQDPVDADERERNDIIHRLQGNRNPFIDSPELVSRIRDF